MNNSQRLLSLDAFRGLTIAGMLLVNNPGRWSDSAIYAPLRHAAWNGCTPTDLVFPFFLFIVGVSLVFSMAARSRAGDSRGRQMIHVVRRSVALFLLGLFTSRYPFLPWGSEGFSEKLAETGLGGCLLRAGLVVAFAAVIALLTSGRVRWPWLLVLGGGLVLMIVGHFRAPDGEAISFWRHLADARLPGVLQRIAVCYCIAAALLLYRGRLKTLILWCSLILVAVAVGMLYVPLPGFGQPDLDVEFWKSTDGYEGAITNWATWLDTHVLGIRAYRFVTDPKTDAVIWAFDPEGLLSTPTALCTVLLGIFCGMWLRRDDLDARRKTIGLLGAGAILLAAGSLMHLWLPLNKRLWTSSYVIFTGGAASLGLGLFFAVMDWRSWRTWARPLVWYGRNAITAFFFSSLMATTLVHLRVPMMQEDGTMKLVAVKTWLFEKVWAPWLDIRPASLFYALGVVVVWALIMGLMHRRKVFWKI